MHIISITVDLFTVKNFTLLLIPVGFFLRTKFVKTAAGIRNTRMYVYLV